MANPPQGNDPPAAPLVDVGGGVFVPEFQTSEDVPTAPAGGGAAAADAVAPPPTPDEILAATQAAIAASPDVASYTVNGETVVRRSIDDQLKLLRAMDQRASRARGFRQTLVDFE